MHPEPPNSGSIRTYRQEDGRGRVVFNTFPMPFRAFGNALSVSIAFLLPLLSWAARKRSERFQSVCFSSAFGGLFARQRFRYVSVASAFFFSVSPPNVFNAFPTTFPETFPMRFLFCLRKCIENVFCVFSFFAPVRQSVFNAFSMRFRPPRGSLETQN